MDTDQDQSPVEFEAVAGLVWGCYSVASIAFFLRLRVRWQGAGFFLDDYAMFLAWLSFSALSIGHTVQARHTRYLMQYNGMMLSNEHQVDYYESEITELGQWQTAIDVLFWTTVWMVKAAFLSLYYNFLKPFDVSRKVWYCVLFFTAATYISCWICRFIVTPQRLDVPVDVIYSTSVDIATDAMIMLLPMLILSSLKLDLRKKFGLAFVFSLAFIVMGSAITRMVVVINQDRLSAYARDENGDLRELSYYDPAYRTLGSTIESSVAIFVGSLPPLKAFLSSKMKNYQDVTKSAQAVERNNQSGDFAPSLEPQAGAIWARKTTPERSGPLASHPLPWNGITHETTLGMDADRIQDVEKQMMAKAYIRN